MRPFVALFEPKVTSMRISGRGLLLAAALAVAALVPAAALADEKYADPVGDGGTAPDVTGVSVMNDNDGNVVFAVKVTGVGSAGPLAAGESYLALFVDTDRNSSTGNKEGAEVLIGFDLGARTWDIVRWNGTDFAAPASVSPNALARFSSDGVVLALHRSDLGGGASFDFWLYGDRFEGESVVASDVAPDGEDVWTYSFATKAVALRATKPAGLPAFPVAGKRFVILSLVSQGSAGGPLGKAKTTCVVRLAGRPLKATASYSPTGGARCAVTLPPRSQGKLLTGSIGVSVVGGQTSRAFRFRVL